MVQKAKRKQKQTVLKLILDQGGKKHEVGTGCLVPWRPESGLC